MKAPARRSSRRQPIPSLQAIARVAGVSVATASLALNRHPRVSAKTTARVNAAATRLGYVPNQAARRLARARFTRNRAFDQVGFVLFDRMGPELDGPYLSLMRGVEHQVSVLGAAMVFLRIRAATDHDKIARLLRAGFVDGWLITGNVDDNALALLRGQGKPCVVLGGHACKTAVPSVDIDFKAVGRMAVEYLANRGHHRIGFIGATMRFPYQRDVLAGFREALRSGGADEEPDLIQSNQRKPIRSMADRLNRLLTMPSPPSAIFTAEPNHATQVLELARQREVNVAGELSLLGCEVESTINRGMPGITRIEQPFSEVGRAGASLLKQLATNECRGEPTLEIPPRLVEGWSTLTRTSPHPTKHRRAVATMVKGHEP